MGSKSSKAPVSKYFMSVHFGICHGPVDSIRAFYAGEKRAWSGDVTSNQTVEIDEEKFFGGLKKEGGLQGEIEFMLGGASQTVSDALAERLDRTPTTAPGYRGMTSAFFRGVKRAGFYWAAGNPYLKPVWFTVRRIPTGLGVSASIPRPDGSGVDANPIHIIYECLTNQDWGMGADPTTLDTAAFTAAASTLANEGFGISMLWNQSGTIEAFVNEVLNHIAGSIFTHPRTGKMTIRLLRDDYDVNALRTINPDNASVSSFSRKAWGETVNEVKVTWTNPSNEKEETVYAQDLGNIAMQGTVVSDSRNYFGVRSAALAQKLCNRELRSASAPLSIIEVTVDRSLWDVTPLECLKVDWPEYGLAGQVMRVMKVNYGRTGASAIKLSLVEDVYSLPNVTFVTPPGSEWVDPAVEPENITQARLFPLPAYMVASEADLSSFAYPEAGMAVIAASPVQGYTGSFDVMLQSPTASGGTEWVTGEEQVPFIGRGALSGALVPEAVSTIGALTSSSRATLLADHFLLIGGDATPMNRMELALVTAYNGTLKTATVRRGILDTIPRAWPQGTPVWVMRLDDLLAVDALFTDGQSVSVKLLTNTVLGSTPMATAPTFTDTILSRAVLPNRPANVRIMGSYWPVSASTAGGPLTVAWSRRNRNLEDTVVLAWTEGDQPDEAGTTYTVALYRVDTNALLVETTGITGTSADISIAYSGLVRLVLSAVRDGLTCYQPFEHSFELLSDGETLTTESGEVRLTESGETRILE